MDTPDPKTHEYAIDLTWTGNRGSGTSSYTNYDRDHVIAAGKGHQINGSADPAFRGDPARWNPEEMLLASVAACHKLWYLHLCSDAGVNVLAYRDAATGQMVENADGSGQFSNVHLHPHVTISADSDAAVANSLHGKVGAMCFIARSVNFKIHHTATIEVGA